MSESVVNEIVNAASSQSGNTSPFFSESANAIISALNGGTVAESTRYSPKVNRIIKAINEGGGGGSSDYTTAKVTINKTANYSWFNRTFDFYIPYVYDDEYGCGIFTINIGDIDTATVLDVPMYKGFCIISVIIMAGFNPSYLETSGDIQYDSADLVITGNGTITCSGPEK